MSLNLFDGLPNPLLSKPFAVLDFETTGLYPAVGDEIVEIGVVRIENGAIAREWSRLVNPGREMDPAAAQVSGITAEMLAEEKPFAFVADEFLDLIRDAVVVAHNAEFDMAFLQYKLVKLGRNQVDNPVLDTLELARSQDDSGQNTLGVLANRLGIEGAHAHRALDDATMTAKVLLHYLEEYHRRGQDEIRNLPGYRGSFRFNIEEGDQERSFKMAVEHVRHAIERGVDLEIDYKGGKGQSRRRVQPRAIRGMSVRAFCYTRGEELDFRLDRILDAVEITADEAPDRADPVVDPGCSETGSPAPTG